MARHWSHTLEIRSAMLLTGVGLAVVVGLVTVWSILVAAIFLGGLLMISAFRPTQASRGRNKNVGSARPPFVIEGEYEVLNANPEEK